MKNDKIKNRPTIKAAGWAYLIAAVGLVVAAALSFILIKASNSITPWLSNSGINVLTNIFYYLLFLCAPTAIYMSRRGTSASYRLGALSPGYIVLTIIAAILGIFICSCITLVWTLLLEKLGINVYAQSLSGYGSIWMALFVIALLPALFEELVFRGVILSATEKNMGTVKAMLVSSILFALLHGSIQGLPVQFALGMAIAYLTVKLDSIYAGMLYHFVHNGATVAMTYFSAGGGYAEVSGSTGLIDMFSNVDPIAITAMVIIVLVLLLGASACYFLIFRSINRRAARRGVELVAGDGEGVRASEIIPFIAAFVIVILRYALNILNMQII